MALNNENQPLLSGSLAESQIGHGGYGDNSHMEPISVNPEQVADVIEATQDTGPSVTCRVCESEISLDGRMMNHVVRCGRCNEATPIRAAPPGKKYVRCPCHCLLICKASSSRIACPRDNCRRVITLGPSGPVGTAIRAPAGTCRVQCCECQEIFMFNTLINTYANCPHCRTISSVGTRYKRARASIYFFFLILAAGFGIGFTVSFSHGVAEGWFAVMLTIAFYAVAMMMLYKCVYFLRMKVSQVLGPV
uniref:Phosphatidylinositol-4,5-bisphosphate 4-phosphatase n=1 Tax=Panagrolaimus superbus TaxID=310955 RepID=A0A914XW14_9BILA